MTTCPKKLNSCFDPNSLIPQLFFCQPAGSNDISGFCNQEGGLGFDPVTGNFKFPEATGTGFGNPGDCNYETFNNQDAQCSVIGGGISGTQGACIKNYNYGDPLNCCLRDYQCNDGTDVYGRTCFSDDTKFATCPREFRAPDTQPCNYLTTQYCLGNYSHNPDDPTYLPPGIDFTALWVNTGIEGQPFEVKSLRTGTRYQLINDRPCTIEDLNPETGAPRSGTTCQLSGIVQAAHDQVVYKTGNTPICQQIFWRTLYGNSPIFLNQYWRTDGGPTLCPADSVVGNFEGFNICENTSIPPQAAACQATSFGGIPTPTGAIWAQSILTAAVNKLRAKGVSITNPVTSGADQPFIQWLYTVCQKYPNLCEGFIKQECAGADPAEFISNQNLWDWCGCYMNDERYKNYTDNFGVTKECSPYCNAPNTVPLVNGDTTQPLFCQQSVCIIDDVAINLVKSRFQDGTNNINFSQICNSCGSGYGSGVNNQGNYNNPTGNSNFNNISTTNCNCIIDNFTLTTINTVITGDGINISQSCNGNSTCYNTVTNTDGSTSSTPIDCVSNGISVNNSVLEYKKTLETRAANISIYWVIFGAIVLVCLIAIIWIFLAPRKLPENDVYFSHKEIIEKPKPKPVPVPTSYNIYEVNPPVDLSPLSKKLDQNTNIMAKLGENLASLKSQLSDLNDQVGGLYNPIEFE
jgi:hypothetical protein